MEVIQVRLWYELPFQIINVVQVVIKVGVIYFDPDLMVISELFEYFNTDSEKEYVKIQIIKMKSVGLGRD